MNWINKYNVADIVRFIKSRRIKGRPRKRWIDDVEDDSRSMNMRRWRRSVSYTHLDVYKRQKLEITINIV